MDEFSRSKLKYILILSIIINGGYLHENMSKKLCFNTVLHDKCVR